MNKSAQNIENEVLCALGARIASLRKCSQVELALLANISKNYLNDVEHGRRNPSVLVLARIAGALNVPLESLFAGIEVPKPYFFE